MKHINLYHKEFQPYRAPLSVRIAKIACGALVLCAIGAYTWHSNRTAEVHAQLREAETSCERLNAQVTEVQQQLQERRADPHLQRRIDTLRQQLNLQRPVFETLQQLSKRQGRSIEVLTTLAQHRLTEVWFTSIQLDNNKHYVRLEGSGANPSAISTALDLLMQQQVFGGQNFELLQIQRLENGAYQFTLGSHTDPQGAPQ